MSLETVIGIVLVVGVAALILSAAIKIVPEYERGVIFRLGRVIGAKGPGLFVIIPVVDRMVRVSLRTTTLDVPPQDIITRDNVTVRVNAVTFFNVVDPVKSVVSIEDYRFGTLADRPDHAAVHPRSGHLDELLTNRDEINQQLQQIIDELSHPWGVKVTIVEIKDVELPDSHAARDGAAGGGGARTAGQGDPRPGRAGGR